MQNAFRREKNVEQYLRMTEPSRKSDLLQDSRFFEIQIFFISFRLL